MSSIARSIVTFGRMIKFSHTIFALPFALTAALLASRSHPISALMVFWIIVAMVGARTAAMGFNRLVDAQIDAKNPRTARREIPAGIITKRTALLFVTLASLLLIFASYQLNELCLMLSPVALGIVFFYSYTKRFTFLAHVFLGIALGVAPLGAWIAVSGSWNWYAFLLGCGVLAWVSGFDIIYACQDYEFDKANNLFSIPSRFGIRQALIFSRLLHVAAMIILIIVGMALDLRVVYFIGLTIVGAILIYEHNLVRDDDLSKVNVAFFNMNGIISLIYFFGTAWDILL